MNMTDESRVIGLAELNVTTRKESNFFKSPLSLFSVISLKYIATEE
jgi:hypothetical protein